MTTVTLVTQNQPSISKINNLMSWFGEIKHTQARMTEPLRCVIRVRFAEQASADQLLVWRHPLLIDGQVLRLENKRQLEHVPTLSTLGTGDTINAYQDLPASPQANPCLRVYQIPCSWGAHHLFANLSAKFPSALRTCLVSIEVIDGYRVGVVELGSSLVALQLLLESTPEISGHKLLVKSLEDHNIEFVSASTLSEFTIFPFVPTSADGCLFTLDGIVNTG